MKYLDNNGTQYNITETKQRLASLVQSISSLAEVAGALATELDGLEDDLGTAAFTNSTDYAAASHTQPSSTITAMTGYSKPQSTSAIEATDTLNQAIGKLEKGLDDAGGGGDLEAHIATNVEDDGGVHGIRCYNGKLEVYNDYSQEWCDPSEVGYRVGNVSNLTIEQGNLSLKLNWSDPADTANATWKGTKVVMKVGSYPESVTDGQLVCDNQVRDAYSTTELVISNLSNDVTYYFQLFPYTTKGAITNDNANKINEKAARVFELGLRVDFINSTFTRLGDAVGLSGGSDFDVFSMYQRRRCNLADDGTINAYLGDANFAVDGSNGQVMVEQPKFYYKVVPVKFGNNYPFMYEAEYWVSNKLLTGYKLHPAFKNTSGTEIDCFYEGAYEGYDNNDILHSISGVAPCYGQYRSAMRTHASNRGSGWRQETIWSLSADQILMIIEYGMFNMQMAIGNGNCNNYYVRLNTGTLNSYGNGSYGTTDNQTTAVQWRGKENPWGNVSGWIDGINIYNYTPYVANTYNFQDNTSTYYTSIGYTTTVSGYIEGFGYNDTYDWIFMPRQNKGSGNSSIPVGDYHSFDNSSQTWRLLLNGGSNSSGLYAGAFCDTMYVNANSGGARLLYVG